MSSSGSHRFNVSIVRDIFGLLLCLNYLIVIVRLARYSLNKRRGKKICMCGGRKEDSIFLNSVHRLAKLFLLTQVSWSWEKSELPRILPGRWETVKFVCMRVCTCMCLFLTCEDWEGRFDESFPAFCLFLLLLLCVLWVEITLCTPIAVSGQGSVHSGSAGWDDCGQAFLMTCVQAQFPDGFSHYAWTV